MLACTALLATSTAFASPEASAAPADGTHLSVSAVVGQSGQQLAVPVAAGLEASHVRASIAVSGRPAGTVVISVRGRVLLEARAEAALSLDAALRKEDVQDQQLVLGLEYLPATRDVCALASTTATLSGISVDTAGNETVPRTVGEFFGPAVTAVLIPVPENPPADVSAGILGAAAAMANRYPDADTSTVAASGLEDRAAALPAGARIVSVVQDSGLATTKLGSVAGHPQLTLSGHGDELRNSALALASDHTALADDATVSGMTTAMPAGQGLTQTVADLGAQNVKLSGYGTQETYLGVSQSQFGGTVSAWTVHLRGTHTAIPDGGKAELSVYWNDYLLSSRTLDGDSFEVNAEVPKGQLQARNGLRLRLAALPAGGDCTGPAGIMPMELTLDTTESFLTGVRGQSVAPGFARFPQVLGESLPVAFDSGASAQANTLNAAALVVSLQHDAAELLQVRLADTNALMESSDSGLVVGATPATADRLSAPLRLAEFRTVGAGTLQYGVGTTAAYGVLEAFEHGGRNVLMLGGWGPGADAGRDAAGALQGSLAGYVLSHPGGWAALSRNLLVTQSSGEPVLLESNGVIPQSAVTDDYRPYGWWVAAAVAVLALAWTARRWRNRRRRLAAAAYADAKERAAGEAVEARTDG